MDAFTVFIANELSIESLVGLAHEAGFNSSVLGEREMSVFHNDAYVWVELLKPSEISPAELDRQEEWPISFEKVRTMVDITVRRTFESEDVAIKLAYLLANKCGGVISWDGMDYWEQLYRTYERTNGTNRRNSAGHFEREWSNRES